MRAAFAILPALAALLMALPARTGPLIVTDGDSLRMGGERIRIWGIDAPELGQTCRRGGRRYDCGAAAHEALRTLIGNEPVACDPVEVDRYGRTVARCTAGGLDLGGLMVAAGWALDDPRYSAGAYAADQEQARDAGRGLWGGSFAAPWEWRRARFTHDPAPSWLPREHGSLDDRAGQSTAARTRPCWLWTPRLCGRPFVPHEATITKGLRS